MFLLCLLTCFALSNVNVQANFVNSFNECNHFFYKGTEKQGTNQNAQNLSETLFYATLFSTFNKIPLLKSENKEATAYIVTGTVPSQDTAKRKPDLRRVTVPSHIWTAVYEHSKVDKSFSFGYIGINQPEFNIMLMSVSEMNNQLNQLYKMSKPSVKIFHDDCFSDKPASEVLKIIFLIQLNYQSTKDLKCPKVLRTTFLQSKMSSVVTVTFLLRLKKTDVETNIPVPHTVKITIGVSLTNSPGNTATLCCRGSRAKDRNTAAATTLVPNTMKLTHGATRMIKTGAIAVLLMTNSQLSTIKPARLITHVVTMGKITCGATLLMAAGIIVAKSSKYKAEQRNNLTQEDPKRAARVDVGAATNFHYHGIQFMVHCPPQTISSTPGPPTFRSFHPVHPPPPIRIYVQKMFNQLIAYVPPYLKGHASRNDAFSLFPHCLSRARPLLTKRSYF
ncbi:Myomegalin [Labeo rohita]|uniref:Myomegalin n=1 Tax=Labeo rohita TaxID=84645 RepID=A0ABQ8L5F5_LABRO|nr:Myomegalin [Labeo rohita]